MYSFSSILVLPFWLFCVGAVGRRAGGVSPKISARHHASAFSSDPTTRVYKTRNFDSKSLFFVASWITTAETEQPMNQPETAAPAPAADEAPVDETAPAPTEETAPATTEETAPTPAPAPAKIETTKLFIGNLDSHCRADDLENKLQSFGEVSEFVFKGKFAFVHYVNRSDAMNALDEMKHDSNFGFRGNPLRIEEASTNQSNKSRHVMVRGLPENITEDKLREHYSAYGEVEGVKLLEKREEHHKMACFIDFASEDAAGKAIESQAPIDGEAVEVKPHRNKRDQRRDRGFGGGGRDRGYGGGGRDRGYGGGGRDRGHSGNDGGGDRYDRGYRGGGYNGSGQYGGVYADRDRRGGYDDRGRGNYDDRRGGGGYNDRGRGGYDNRRGGGGGYDDRRSGGRSYDDRRSGGGGHEGRRSRSPAGRD